MHAPVHWCSGYVGRDQAAYRALVRDELAFYEQRLNPLLQGCGWPTFSAAELEGLLGANARRWLAL